MQIHVHIFPATETANVEDLTLHWECDVVGRRGRRSWLEAALLARWSQC